VKLIHPKTGVVREVDEAREMKLAALKRAGFVPFASYKPKVIKKPEPEPSLADVVESQAEKMEIAGVKVAAEKAIHGEISPMAKPLSEMSMKELRALAKERGIEIPSSVRSKKGVAALLAE